MKLAFVTLCLLMYPTSGFADSFSHLYEEYHPPQRVEVDPPRPRNSKKEKAPEIPEEDLPVDQRAYNNYEDYRAALKQAQNPNKAPQNDENLEYGWSVNSYAFSERNF